jgi:hypothetical protein
LRLELLQAGGVIGVQQQQAVHYCRRRTCHSSTTEGIEKQPGNIKMAR